MTQIRNPQKRAWRSGESREKGRKAPALSEPICEKLRLCVCVLVCFGSKKAPHTLVLVRTKNFSLASTARNKKLNGVERMRRVPEKKKKCGVLVLVDRNPSFSLSLRGAALEAKLVTSGWVSWRGFWVRLCVKVDAGHDLCALSALSPQLRRSSTRVNVIFWVKAFPSRSGRREGFACLIVRGEQKRGKDSEGSASSTKEEDCMRIHVNHHVTICLSCRGCDEEQENFFPSLQTYFRLLAADGSLRL